MKANELRIGNKLNYQIGTTLKQGTVLGITKYKIVIDNIPIKTNCKELVPIPLTEEWMNKFGFHRTGFKEDGDVFEIDPKMGGIWIMYDSKDNEWFLDEYRDVIIKYVHQLQNLYFALTGEELKLN